MNSQISIGQSITEAIKLYNSITGNPIEQSWYSATSAVTDQPDKITIDPIATDGFFTLHGVGAGTNINIHVVTDVHYIVDGVQHDISGKTVDVLFDVVAVDNTELRIVPNS
jgi:hypothetical protein